MAVIDLRGESARLAQGASVIADTLKELFGSEEQKALQYATKHPQLARELASSARSAMRAGMPTPEGPGNDIVRGLVKLFPSTPEEEQMNYARAQTQGPQRFAMSQLNSDIDPVSGKKLNLPEKTPAQRAYAELMTSGASEDELMAAAPVALEAHRKSMNLRTASITARDLFEPEELTQFEAAVSYIENGGNPEIGKLMMPKTAEQKIELDKLVRELNIIKDNDQADLVATEWGIRNKYYAPGTKRVTGAANFMANERSKLKERAYQATLARQKQHEGDIEAALLGTAMEAYAMNNALNPQQVRDYLKSFPVFANRSDGELYRIATQAQTEIRKAYAPQTDAQARQILTYSATRLGMQRVLHGDPNAKDPKKRVGLIDRGVTLGWRSALATVDDKATMLGGAGLGYVAGRAVGHVTGNGYLSVPASVLGGGVGVVAGGTIGAVGAPTIRGIGMRLMSSEEQELFTLAQSITASVYRVESGAAVRPEEVRQTMERFIPLSSNKPEVIALKKMLLEELNSTLSRITGMPKDVAIQQYEAFGRRADALLDAAGNDKVEALLPDPPRPEAPKGTGTVNPFSIEASPGFEIGKKFGDKDRGTGAGRQF